MNKKPAPPKRRSAVVQAMMKRSANAGPHQDKKKEDSRTRARKPVRREDHE